MVVRSWLICCGKLLVVGLLITSSSTSWGVTNDRQAFSQAAEFGGVELAAEDVENRLPAFRAGGSEPGWTMEWDGNTLTIVSEYGTKTAIFTDHVVTQEIPEGWRLEPADGFEVLVLRDGCTDLAEMPHDFEIDAQVFGRRLVGCGDKTE